MPEDTWLWFRLAHFPDLGEDAAKDALLEWAEENKIEVTMRFPSHRTTVTGILR